MRTWKQQIAHATEEFERAKLNLEVEERILKRMDESFAQIRKEQEASVLSARQHHLSRVGQLLKLLDK